MRALPPRSHFGYVPLSCRIPREGTAGDNVDNVTSRPELWLLTGLGSRGLIHHALMGRTVAQALLNGDEGLLIEHTRRVAVRLTQSPGAA